MISIIDYNQLQGIGKIKDIIRYNSLSKIFKSFGWETIEVDGHNLSQLIKANSKKNIKPLAIIANTIKGKGIKTFENKLSSHYHIIKDQDEKVKFLRELDNK